jgi:hypothetical protein
MVVAIWLISPMTAPMPWIAPTASWVAVWICAICAAISPVALAVWVARFFHLRRDHGEAVAGLAGARRLDRGVERQQVGLPGDVLDQRHHVADLLRAVGERPNRGVGALRVGVRLVGDLRRLRRLAADLRDRGGELIRPRSRLGGKSC